MPQVGTEAWSKSPQHSSVFSTGENNSTQEVGGSRGGREWGLFGSRRAVPNPLRLGADKCANIQVCVCGGFSCACHYSFAAQVYYIVIMYMRASHLYRSWGSYTMKAQSYIIYDFLVALLQWTMLTVGSM